jgi:hypothetical protein
VRAGLLLDAVRAREVRRFPGPPLFNRLPRHSATASLGYRVNRLPDRAEILEPGPQPYRLITVAELPPLGALSLAGDPPAKPRQVRVALSRGNRKQVSLSF